MLKFLRTAVWWNALVPQVLGWIYFCWLCDGIIPFQSGFLTDNILALVAFFFSLICISAFGYLLNDWCDIQTDALAGKENKLAKLNPAWRVVVVGVPLVLGGVAWRQQHTLATVLLALQIVALVMYSAPPFRFKNRAAWGVATDAFYGHINPVFITLFAFGFFEDSGYWGRVIIAAILFVSVTLKGIRNILLHQLDDRKRDSVAGVQTFVVKNGPLFTLYLTNNLLRFEVIFTVFLFMAISVLFPPFFFSILLFSIITYLKFSGWKLGYIPKRQLKFKFLYFLNDYYEDWVPVFFLLLLSVRQPEILFLLLLHLFLFPSFLLKLWKDVKTIQQNFKTEDDY